MERKVAEWISNYLKSDNYSISLKACHMLVDYLGNDLNKITNQLKKLKIICSNKDVEISPLHIQDNIGISKDYNIFELQKALSFRGLNKSL